jgi:DNA polymerase-3 subunit gamma/tau
MAGYLVLARKYRSLTFEEVVGQGHIATTLVNAIRTGRVAHAYLFTGTRGVGKTTMARILAKALNCLKSDEPTAQPCNECDACVAIGRGDDIDVIEIDGASNRGIDEIRQLRANAIFRPARCRYKIYYIDEVHMLTKEAFNALLKTLEEPPEHVKFIFATTEVEKVPATIVSRCQRFDFRNIPTAQIAAHLAEICGKEGVKASGDAVFRVARSAAGSMRDGLSLLDQLLSSGAEITDEQVVDVLGTPADEQVMGMVSAIAEGNSAGALAGLEGILASGVTLSNAAGALASAFRNMMIASTCGAASHLLELPESQKKTVGEVAGRFSLPTLVQDVAICQNVWRAIRGSSVARALLEAAIVRMAEADKFVDPSSLIERLEALAGGEKKNFETASPPRRAVGTPAARPASAPEGAHKSAPAEAPATPAGQGPDAQTTPPSARPGRLPLSSEDKRRVSADPAVKEVLSLFGGEIVDMWRQPPAGEQNHEDDRDQEST